VIAVLDRLEGAAEAFARRGIGFRSLVTIRDLGVEPLERPAYHAEGEPLVIHPQIEPMPPLQGP
jgi:hypothetical protein